MKTHIVHPQTCYTGGLWVYDACLPGASGSTLCSPLKDMAGSHEPRSGSLGRVKLLKLWFLKKKVAFLSFSSDHFEYIN
jgi:hypothetical protein